MQFDAVRLTVPTGLDGSLNVPNALDGHTVLVVAVDIHVLELSNLVDENAELVRDVRDIFVAHFTPDRELLLRASVMPMTIASDIQQLPCARELPSPCCA